MSNKFLKSILIILYVVIGVSLSFMIVNDSNDSKIDNIYKNPGYTKFNIPDLGKDDTNYRELLDILERVSIKTDTPFVVRSSNQGYSSKNGKINFSEPISSITFFGLDKSNTVVTSHGVKTSIRYESIDKIVYEQFSEGTLFYKNTETSSKFIHLLKEELEKNIDIKFETQDFQNEIETSPPISYNNTNLTSIITLSLIFYFIFLYVWLLENNNKIAVYLLNGFDIEKISKKILLNKLFVVGFLTYLISSVFIVKQFNLAYTVNSILIYFVSYLITYLSIFIVSKKSISNQVNNKSFSKYNHFFLYAVKIIIFSLSLATMSGVVTLVNNAIDFNKNDGLEKYSTLYPSIIGQHEDLSKYISYQNLYQQLETLGGIHSEESTMSAQLNLPNIDSIDANDNFVNSQNLINIHGKKVEITPQEKRGIILISEKASKIKNIKSKIKSYYTDQSYFDSGEFVFYTLKNDQFLSILGKNKTYKKIDVISVFTKNNSDGNMILSNTQNPYAMLIPLDNSLKHTYESIKPSLIKDGILSMYPSLIKASDIPKTEILTTIGNPSNFIFINFFLFSLFILMILATTSFYIKIYRKRIAVYRLQGLSFYKTYQPIIILMMIQIVIGMLNLLVTNASINAIQLLIVYIGIEIIIVISMIYNIDKRDTLNILKGE